jgi:ribosomal RNA-processing protein 12
MGGRTSATAVGRSSVAPSGVRASHSGDRFRSKKSGGDVKGSSRIEPYAYWPLDRKMLNKKRRGKQAAASKGLEKIVTGAKQGAAKGRKAKRQRT